MSRAKTIKVTGDRRYIKDILIPMLDYIDKGNGCKVGYATNHHTVIFEFNTGEKVRAYGYETDTMIVISWGEE